MFPEGQNDAEFMNKTIFGVGGWGGIVLRQKY